jgi:hypothetical protein
VTLIVLKHKADTGGCVGKSAAVVGNALKLFNRDGKLCLLLLENSNVRGGN